MTPQIQPNSQIASARATYTHGQQTTHQPPAANQPNNRALARMEADPLSVLFHRFTQHTYNLVSNVVNRLPSLKQFAWALIQPVMGSNPRFSQPGSSQPAENNIADNRFTNSARNDLLDQLRASPAFARAALINRAADQSQAETRPDSGNTDSDRATQKKHFDQAVDWLSDKYLTEEKGSSIKTQRDIFCTPPHICQQEDHARLLQQGISLDALAHRQNLPPVNLTPPLKPLLTPRTLAAMVRNCPTIADNDTNAASDTTETSTDNPTPNDAFKDTAALLSYLSDQLEEHAQVAKASVPTDLPNTRLTRMIEHCKYTAAYTDITEKQADLQSLVKFKTQFANLLWLQHYPQAQNAPSESSPSESSPSESSPSESTKGAGTESPKSVMFFPGA